MSRVPTLASNQSFVTRMLQQQTSLYKAQYSATTYKKSQNYSGIASDSYRLLNLKSEKATLEAQVSCNQSLSTRIQTMSNSIDAVKSAITSFRSTLRDFSANDLSAYVSGNMDADKQNEIDKVQQLAFDTMKQIEYYLNTKIDDRYLFGGGSVYESPVTIPFGTLEEFQEYYDGQMVTYAESRSSNLVTYQTSPNKTGGVSLQKLMTTVEGTAAGTMTIADGNSLIAGNAGTFSDLEVGMEVTVKGIDGTDFVSKVKSISADGSVIVFEDDLPATATVPADLADLQIVQDQKLGTISSVNTDGFIVDNIQGSDTSTGDFAFDATRNQMSVPINGAFSKLTAGSTILITGTGANDGIKYVESVSADGRTVTFSDETPVVNDPTYVATSNVNIGISFPVGSTINMENVNPSYDGPYTIVGISDDGQSLIVRTDKFPDTEVTFDDPATLHKQSIGSTSYYGGDSLKIQYRVDSNTSIDMGINAEDPAFEKALRALGMIAQGNMIDEEGVDLTRVYNRVTEALNLLDSALENVNMEGESSSNIALLENRLANNLIMSDNALTNQQKTIDLLTTNISNIEDVDPLEAALELTAASDALEASYSILASVSQLSLLNYLK
ncbi:MAG: hypothetical protein IKD08_00205 [Alphaproteobacteria bacterium]|nr:hypothetical protein [Alphaproteobacteria bacterium]